MTAAEAHELLQELFPVRSGYRWLEYVSGDAPPASDDDAPIRGTFRLVVLDPEPPDANGVRGSSIRDVKEQDLWLVPAEARAQPARVAAYLRGWAAALAEVVDGAARFDCLMPHDLAGPGALRLHSVSTEEGFCRAFWQRARLGKLVPGLAPRRGERFTPAALQGPATAEWLRRALRDLLPLREGAQDLSLADDEWFDCDGAGAWARLRRGRGPAERRLLVPAAALEDARRVRAYLCGWAAAVCDVLRGSSYRLVDGAFQELRWDPARVSAAALVAPAVTAVLDDATLIHPEEFAQALAQGPFAGFRAAP